MLEFLKALFWSYTFPVIHLWASWCCYIWYCCLCWWYCSLLCDLIKCVETSDLWQQLELASELESDLPDTLEWGRKWLNDFNVGKTQLVWFDRSNKTGATNVKVDGPGLAEKSFLRWWGWLSLQNWIGVLTLSLLLKLPRRKRGPWFFLWSFFLLRMYRVSL